MFIKRNFVFVLVVLMFGALISGCGAALKDSGGDQTTTIPVQEQIDQVLGCVCHPQYGEFLQSRHADANNSPNRASCDPCHTGIDSIGDYITPEPKYFVDCASCHEPDGTKHGAINAGLRQAGTSTLGALFTTCTECHSPMEGGAHEDHHSIDGYRYWQNANGDNVGGEKNAPSMAVTTIASYDFEVWSLPDAGAWAETDVYHGEVITLEPYAGPYYFNGDRTINDTHFNEVWILNEDDKVTRFAVPTARLGYVDLTNTSPNSGMVTAGDDQNACLASCHSPHTFDKTVQQQWADGPHHPIAEGPIVADDNTVAVASGPAAWGAVDHQGFGADCVRCHNSVGFVAAGGAYSDSVDLGAWNDAADGFITCNACHDGENYPTAFNDRLRLKGDATIFTDPDVPADVDTVIADAGASATCIYCHQGRSKGIDVKERYASALSTSNFGGANSHYLAAAGIIWKTVGYEFAASYENVSYFAHDLVGVDDEDGTGTRGPCVTCHMAGEPSNHYFSVEVDGALPAVCANCHDPAEGHELTLAEVEEEGEGYEEALDILIDKFELDGVFYLSSYPYFFDTSAGGYSNAFTAWTSEEQLGAAFNLNLLKHEPGAFAHNRYYAKRLLFDSIDWVEDGTLDGTIVDYSLTYPDGAAWLGTARP
ncbi:MAG: hypothetical protein RRA32_04040 [bacterium]|nr:hypothetical protein [bacterium]